jgi:hypothetical protein
MSYYVTLHVDISISCRQQLMAKVLALQDLEELRCNCITDFLGGRCTTNVLGLDSALNDILHSLINGLCKLWKTQRVLEHHAHR